MSDRGGQAATEVSMPTSGTTLEALVAGAHVRGVRPGLTVEVITTTWHGADAVTLVYRLPDGSLGQDVLYRAHEQRLSLVTEPFRWTFDADAADFRLAADDRSSTAVGRVRCGHCSSGFEWARGERLRQGGKGMVLS